MNSTLTSGTARRLLGFSLFLIPLVAACGGSGGSDADLVGTGGALTSPASGGSASGGSPGNGTESGGTATGGATTGGSSSGGGSASGGSASGGSSGVVVVKSKGCGVSDGAKKLTTGGSSVSDAASTSTRLSIMSSGASRDYIVDIPDNYDPSHPYRLVFSWHQAYGSANGNAKGEQPAYSGPNFNAENYAFFGLRREANNAGDPVIFVAPQGIGNFPWDFNRDSVLFDNLLARVTENLCIDESRVFSTGFSFGAMMTYSLSITRQSKLRGVVAMAPANFNLPGQPTDSGGHPIAYLGFTGMSEDRCRWVDNESLERGGKYCALTHAEDNNCTIPANIPTEQVGSKDYLCYDFAGCDAAYPVKVCTFDGMHTPSSVNNGITNGDDGLHAFIPPIAWDFISKL